MMRRYLASSEVETGSTTRAGSTGSPARVPKLRELRNLIKGPISSSEIWLEIKNVVKVDTEL